MRGRGVGEREAALTGAAGVSRPGEDEARSREIVTARRSQNADDRISV